MPALPPTWLRGPVPGIEPILQPVAHALLQVAEETPEVVQTLTPEQIWSRPGGSASIGFHLAHLCGSLDRLFTYARGESLSTDQQAALAAERVIDAAQPSPPELFRLLSGTVERAMEQLRSTPGDSLVQAREVGRARLPSTTLGLLFHAAEHTIRHGGQIITLARVVQGPPERASAAVR
ncbi:MAG: DinB family protein [Gemmatimonadota bacterium]